MKYSLNAEIDSHSRRPRGISFQARAPLPISILLLVAMVQEKRPPLIRCCLRCLIAGVRQCWRNRKRAFTFSARDSSFQAGRIMLSRIKELLKEGKDFAFETTPSTRSYVPFVRYAKERGYIIVLINFWLESVDLAKNRVLERVRKGRHSIPEDTIERRYYRGLNNFFKLISKSYG